MGQAIHISVARDLFNTLTNEDRIRVLNAMAEGQSLHSMYHRRLSHKQCFELEKLLLKWILNLVEVLQ